MAQRHAHSQPIETYGLAPHNRNIWPSAHNRNIWPYNSQATVFCHAWPILLSGFQLAVYPLLDWLWYPMFWFHRRNSGAHGAENSIQIYALAGVEPRTLGI